MQKSRDHDADDDVHRIKMMFLPRIFLYKNYLTRQQVVNKLTQKCLARAEGILLLKRDLLETESSYICVTFSKDRICWLFIIRKRNQKEDGFFFNFTHKLVTNCHHHHTTSTSSSMLKIFIHNIVCSIHKLCRVDFSQGVFGFKGKKYAFGRLFCPYVHT